jgi:hypothetical protein
MRRVHILEYESTKCWIRAGVGSLVVWVIGVAATVVWILNGQMLYWFGKTGGFEGLVGVAGYLPEGGNYEGEYWIVSVAFLGTWVGSTCILFGLPWAPRVRFRKLISPVELMCLALAESWLLVAGASFACEVCALGSVWFRSGARWPAISSLLGAWAFVLALLWLLRRRRIDVCLHVRFVRRASVLLVAGAIAWACYGVLRHPDIPFVAQGAYTAIFLGWCSYLWSVAGCRVVPSATADSVLHA